MRTIWKVIIILIAAGLILSVIGLSLGASRTLYWSRAGVHVTDSRKVSHITEPDTGQFTGVYVEAGFSDVEFVHSDKYGIELYGKDMDWSWSLENGILKIGYTSGPRIQVWNIDVMNTERNYIKVFIPDNAGFETVNIRADSGDVKIGDFKATSVEITNSFGDLDFSDVTSDQLKIELNSGRFTGTNLNARNLIYNNSFGDGRFRSVSAEILTADSDSGDLHLTGCVFGELNIRSSFGQIIADDLISSKTNVRNNSGDVRLSGEFTGETVVHSEFGNIDLTTSGVKEDYSFDISVRFGNIKFDGARLGDSASVTSGSKLANHLKITASSGDITVVFAG